MLVKKGTYTFIVDENKNTTNMSISMDKDRTLSIGDIFIWNEDLKPHYHVSYVVVGFADFMPLVVEMAA